MNICFISIFDLTRVQFEMATRLERDGHQVYWLTTNPTWTAWLRTQDVPDSRILELSYTNEQLQEIPNVRQLTRELAAAESVSGITVNLSLMADQFVMYKHRQDTNRFALLYYRDIKNFLKANQIEIVFAEPTNSNELIASIVCAELEIPFLFPQSLRYPDRRFFFGKGIVPAEMHGENEEDSAKHDGASLINTFVETKARPSYFTASNNLSVISTEKTGKSIVNRLKPAESTERIFLTHHDNSERLRYTIRRLINGFYLNRLVSYDNLDQIEGRIAFFGLHVQPENSIDVQGPYFSDQLKLIKDIRRALPFDTTLVVKEHPNRFGSRPLSFFRELRNIPNVRIVHHSVSSFDIYAKSSMVLTVAGTTAYEAGLLGIPAILFSRMYFDGLSTISACEDISQLKPLAERLLSGVTRDFNADARFMESLMRRSYNGYWTDPITDAAVMQKTNLDLLYAGFKSVVSHVPTPQYV